MERGTKVGTVYECLACNAGGLLLEAGAMYTITRIDAMKDHRHETCLNCKRPVVLSGGPEQFVRAVKDEGGATIGFLHVLCEPLWKDRLSDSFSSTAL